MNFISQIALNLIVTLVQSMMDNGLVAALQELIEEAFNWDMPGEQKRAAVMQKLEAIGGVVGDAVSATAPWLLNLALEALVAKAKVESE